MALDPRHLLQHHTIFPYATAFMPEEHRERWVSLLTEAAGDAKVWKSSATIAQSVAERVQVRRMCPSCISEDLERFGESYWHRSHCLPATYYCLKHDRWLVNTQISVVRPTTADNYLLPQRTPGTGRRIRVSTEIARHLAQYSTRLLDSPGGLSWTDTYRSLASEKGYLLPGNAFAGLGLARSLAKFYSASLMRDVNLKVAASETKAGWPAQLLRQWQPLALAVTVKHVLLRVFLENAAPAGGEFEYTKPGRRPGDRARVDEALAKAVRRIVLQAEHAGDKLKVTEVLVRAGGWADYRHNRKLYPLTEIEILKLRRSKVSVRPVRNR